MKENKEKKEPQEIQKALAAKIKAVLSEKNMTQNDLAEKLGIYRVSVSRLLSEGNDLRVTTLQKIADAIGCQVSDFFSSVSYPCCPWCGMPVVIEAHRASDDVVSISIDHAPDPEDSGLVIHLNKPD